MMGNVNYFGDMTSINGMGFSLNPIKAVKSVGRGIATGVKYTGKGIEAGAKGVAHGVKAVSAASFHLLTKPLKSRVGHIKQARAVKLARERRHSNVPTAAEHAEARSWTIANLKKHGPQGALLAHFAGAPPDVSVFGMSVNLGQDPATMSIIAASIGALTAIVTSITAAMKRSGSIADLSKAAAAAYLQQIPQSALPQVNVKIPSYQALLPSYNVQAQAQGPEGGAGVAAQTPGYEVQTQSVDETIMPNTEAFQGFGAAGSSRAVSRFSRYVCSWTRDMIPSDADAFAVNAFCRAVRQSNLSTINFYLPRMLRIGKQIADYYEMPSLAQAISAVEGGSFHGAATSGAGFQALLLGSGAVAAGIGTYFLARR